MPSSSYVESCLANIRRSGRNFNHHCSLGILCLKNDLFHIWNFWKELYFVKQGISYIYEILYMQITTILIITKTGSIFPYSLHGDTGSSWSIWISCSKSSTCSSNSDYPCIKSNTFSNMHCLILNELFISLCKVAVTTNMIINI